jgi:hypothetical protein
VDQFSRQIRPSKHFCHGSLFIILGGKTRNKARRTNTCLKKLRTMP